MGLSRVRNGSETKKKIELRKAKLLLTSYVFSTTPRCQEFETDPKQQKEMEPRKAKLLLTSYVFSTTPHCQEFETDPKQKKMELRKAKLFLTSYVFSTTPHCQEFETDPNQKKWNSEQQNYSSLHMSFRPHHIAKSSKRIRNKKKMELRKAKLFLTSYVFSTTPHCQEFETD